jgi:type II secretory pathway component PulM
VIFEEILKNYSGNNQYEWIISLGKLNSGMQAEFEKIPDCQALEWLSQIDIAHLIRDTDLAITRGSATTLAELTIER